MKISDCGLLKLLCQKFLAEASEVIKIFNQDCWCPGRDANRAPLK
jgi:hypothetical protein